MLGSGAGVQRAAATLPHHRRWMRFGGEAFVVLVLATGFWVMALGMLAAAAWELLERRDPRRKA